MALLAIAASEIENDFATNSETYLNIVKELLKAGAKPNLQNVAKNTALILASQNGYTEIVKELLKAGAKPNLQNVAKNTALILASQNGYAEIVKELLKKDANPNLRNEYGYTALILASTFGHTEIVQELLKDSNVNERSNLGETALIFASQKGHIKVAKLLIQHKADLNSQNKVGNTALMLAVSNGHADVVKLLLTNGANPNLQEEENHTALMMGAWVGNTKIVKSLLTNEATPDLQNKFGNTALIIAAEKGHLEVIRALLAAGADPTLQNKENQTALSLATPRGNTHIVRLLRDALSEKQHVAPTTKKAKKRKRKAPKSITKCPIEGTNVPLHTAAAAALQQHTTEPEPTPTPMTPKQIQEQEKIHNTTALWEFVTTGNRKEVTVLLGKPFNPNHVNEHGDTLLMHAIKKAIVDPATRRYEVFLALLNNSAIVETINQQNHKNETPLMLGITDVSITQQLLTSGASPDITDERDNTIIIRAVQKDGTTLKNILHLLKEQLSDDQYTALLNKQNQDDMSALMYAIQKNDSDNVALLLSHGANFNIVNNQGLTPLELAHQVRALVTSAEEPDKEHVAQAEEVTQILQAATQPVAEPPAPESTPQKQIVLGDDPLFDELAKGSRAKVTAIEAIISEKPRDLLRQRAGGTTPLMVAIESNVTEKVLRSLLEQLSQEHMQLVETKSGETKSGETALHKAIKNSRVKFVQLLLEQKVPFAKHDIGLARALLATAKKAKQKGKVMQLKAIIDLLEKTYTQQEQGNQLLVAAFAGDLTKVDTALDAGASINTQDKDGNTPLMQAIKAKKVTTARHLIEREARLNIQNDQGNTALMLAVQQNNYGLVAYLLRHDADETIQDNNNATAYGYATKADQTNIANRILTYQALKNLKKTGNIAHVSQRHHDPKGNKTTEIIGKAGLDIDNNPYTGRLINKTITSFFPRSWTKETIQKAIESILERPEQLHVQPAQITEDDKVLRNALILRGTYQGTPTKVIISDTGKGWIVFTAYPDIKK